MSTGEIISAAIAGIVAISLGFIQLRMAALKDLAEAARVAAAEAARLAVENGAHAVAIIGKADHITELTNSRLTTVTTKLDSAEREVVELKNIVSRLIQSLPSGAPVPILAPAAPAPAAPELAVDTITTEAIITKQ